MNTTRSLCLTVVRSTLLLSLGSFQLSAQAQAEELLTYLGALQDANRVLQEESAAKSAESRECAEADVTEGVVLKEAREYADVSKALDPATPSHKPADVPDLRERLSKLKAAIPDNAKAAQKARARCKAAEERLEASKADRKKALVGLSNVAALGIQGTLTKKEAAKIAEQPTQTAQAPSREKLKTIIEAAAKAQEKARDQRAAVAAIYEEVDAATASALALESAADRDYMSKARTLQALAGEARSSARGLQSTANDLVDKALSLKECSMKYDSVCANEVKLLFAQADASNELLNKRLDASKKAEEAVLDSALHINIASKHLGEKDRLAAYRFAKLLKDYPDSAASFSEDGLQIEAGTKPRATLKLGINRLLPGGWRTASISFSTPLDGSRSDVFGSADGLADVRKVGLSWQAQNLRGRLGDLLVATSLNLNFGDEKRSYYEDGPGGLALGPKSKRVTPLQAGAALALHAADRSDAHVLSLNRQHTHDLKAAQIRCPADAGDFDFVKCVQSSFGAPSAVRSWLGSYEYRFKQGDFAASPSVSYNSHSRVTTVGLPLYLNVIKNSDDGKLPLNAGLRLEWNSKGRESVTGRTENTWSWGVFVGAPFKLFGLPD